MGNFLEYTGKMTEIVEKAESSENPVTVTENGTEAALPLVRKKQSIFELVKAVRQNPRIYLALLRAAKNWTMEEGATVIGVSRQTWANWEAEKIEIKLVYLEEIVKLWLDTWKEA